MKGLIVGMAVVALVACLGPPVLADWDVYTSVPDVNKLNRDPQDQWPDPGDLSCWQASAGNLLAGAGYGTGANPQARGDSIYKQLITDLGWTYEGETKFAVNYWLYTYGKNPDSAEFKPANTYTDVYLLENPNGLIQTDYNSLLDELVRCQYVSVFWSQPEAEAHWMTLVGGNRQGSDPEHSVWHDSDCANWGPGNPSEEDYANSFDNGWWDLTDNKKATKSLTFCPGLNKPEHAMREYDVAWFLQDTDQNGEWVPDFREAGYMKEIYDDPVWENSYTVKIDNVEVEDWEKDVWLLVDYTDRVANRDEKVRLLANGQYWVPTVLPSADNGQLLFYWDLDFQPEFEKLIFPDTKYRYLSGNVKDWDFSCYCIPEPATLSLVVLGALLLTRRQR